MLTGGGGHTRKSGPENRPLEFRTENIGQWAARQEGLFAEQNRKDAEAKAKREQKIKRARIWVWIGCGVLVVLALVSAVVVMTYDPKEKYAPEIAGSSQADIVDYQGILQQFYNKKKDEKTEGQDLDDKPAGTGTTPELSPELNQELMGDVNEVVQNTLGTASGKENLNAVRCAQVYFYYNNGYYQELVETAQQIDLEGIDAGVKANVYEVMANAYYALGDEENGDKYFNLVLSMPAGGMGYGGPE